MKLIDRGYYYDVYDLGNGLVYKKRRNIFLTLLFFIFHFRNKLNKLPDQFNYFLFVNKNLKNNYKQIPKCCYPILGNPIFNKNGIDYKQNKCLILKDCLKDISNNDFSFWVDEYIKTIHLTWMYGFSDVIFNITMNTGKDISGRIVQVDFNEISFNKEDVLKQLEKKYWTCNFSFGQLSNEQKEVFLEKMNKDINKEKLEVLWNSKTC
jgi:hypothetical protein